MSDLDNQRAAPPQANKCRSCSQCCAVYCFVCSILLIVFSQAVRASKSFSIIAIKHEWHDIGQKHQAATLAAAYYFGISILLTIHGYVWPWAKQRCSSHYDDSDQEFLIEAGSEGQFASRGGSKWKFREGGRHSHNTYGSENGGEELQTIGRNRSTINAQGAINRSSTLRGADSLHNSTADAASTPTGEYQQP